MSWKTKLSALQVGDVAECIVPSSIPELVLQQGFSSGLINGLGWMEGKKVVITKITVGMRTGLKVYHFGDNDKDYGYEHTLRKVL